MTPFLSSIHRPGWAGACSPLPVGGGGAPLDGAHFDQEELGDNVKEKPPVPDAAAKGGWLIRERHDVAGSRIRLHLRECRADETPDP